MGIRNWYQKKEDIDLVHLNETRKKDRCNSPLHAGQRTGRGTKVLHINILKDLYNFILVGSLGEHFQGHKWQFRATADWEVCWHINHLQTQEMRISESRLLTTCPLRWRFCKSKSVIS